MSWWMKGRGATGVERESLVGPYPSESEDMPASDRQRAEGFRYDVFS